MSEDPNAAVIASAQAAASNVGAAVTSASSSVATAVQADAERLAVKDEAKAGSWLHNEWASRLKDSEAELAAIEARIAALFAEAKALLKAKL